MIRNLYRWPPASAFGRPVSKTKFYETGTVAPAVRKRYVSEVQSITWSYKLAEMTINLRGTAEIPEIQVFEIEAKGEDIGDTVLASIDKAVRTPIIFEIAAMGQRRCAAALKQIGTYYSTDWLPEELERRPLPAALDLSTLYTSLMESLMDFTVRPGEDASALAARLGAATHLEREIAVIERKMHTEPQFNRKVELLRDLKAKQDQLTILTSPSPSKGSP